MPLDATSVGRRVVVRYAVGGAGPSGGPALSDVIGRVRAVDAAAVTLERRDGRTQVVALADVVTWKPVPDRPLRRRRAGDIDPADLTRITSRGLAGHRVRRTRRLGAAYVRAIHRASQLRRRPRRPGPATSATHSTACATFYASHDSPALAQVVVGSAGERAFAGAGWVPMTGYHGGAVVQVADLDPAYDADPAARITATADDDWLVNYGRVNDPVAARAVLEGPDTVGFVSIGTPAVAIGRVVVTGEWAGIAVRRGLPRAPAAGPRAPDRRDLPRLGRGARSRQGVPPDDAHESCGARALRAVRLRRPPRLPLPRTRAPRRRTMKASRTSDG